MYRESQKHLVVFIRTIWFLLEMTGKGHCHIMKAFNTKGQIRNKSKGQGGGPMG